MRIHALYSVRKAGLFLSLIAGVLVGSAWASTTQVIYSFGGGPDGEYADTELVMDSAGNLYGTTVQGGQYSAGTVFELSPSGNTWVHTVLYSFTGGTDGGEPYKGVTLDSQGNIYGTAGIGGLNVGPCVDTGCGVVFQMTKSGSQWSYNVIHSFTGGNDGFGPGAGVTVDKNANVYGMTPTGGANSAGVVYALHRDNSRHWGERIIHTFTGGADGSGGSAGRLVIDSGGNLYGTCTTGGANGAGNVFELTPTPVGEFNINVLYAFKGQSDSGFPYAGLVADQNHNIYGTTYYDGANGMGTIYRLSRRNGAWAETGIYSFKGGNDGSGPIGTLVFGADGNLYGTTSVGGASCNCGTIFKVDPKTPSYAVEYRFGGMPDGAFVYNGMIPDAAGQNFYGATVHGGNTDDGTIYKFTP